MSSRRGFLKDFLAVVLAPAAVARLLADPGVPARKVLDFGKYQIRLQPLPRVHSQIFFLDYTLPSRMSGRYAARKIDPSLYGYVDLST